MISQFKRGKSYTLWPSGEQRVWKELTVCGIETDRGPEFFSLHSFVGMNSPRVQVIYRSATAEYNTQLQENSIIKVNTAQYYTLAKIDTTFYN